MNSKIGKSLMRMFEEHRIVFWYDSKKELHSEFEALDLPGVVSVEINNDEFGLKYRMLREEPEQKFLVYKEGPAPALSENWLLDLELACGVFLADKAALWLSELGLGAEFMDLVQKHSEFFRAGSRLSSLKEMLTPSDSLSDIQGKMLAVCCGCSFSLDLVLESLLDEHALEKDDRFTLVLRCKLDSFLWDSLRRIYGYSSEEPGLQDFALCVFDSCFKSGIGEKGKLLSESIVFLNRFKDSRKFREAFEVLSEQASDVLEIPSKIASLPFTDLIELDYFKCIDIHVITALASEVLRQTISTERVEEIIRQRRKSHWYDEFEKYYEAVLYASLFLGSVEAMSISISSAEDGIDGYLGSWYMVDMYYRKFIHFNRASGKPQFMNELTERIDSYYSNKFLLRVNDKWQNALDAAGKWGGGPLPMQKDFYSRYVKPVLEKGNRIVVIVSDALRYEVAEELLSLIRKEDRYSGELDALLGMLPSYTQLGMAALLPGDELRLADDSSGKVFVDGVSSSGTENRSSILRKSHDRSTALKADEVMILGRDEGRDLLKQNDVVYIYHNRIDSIGDKRETEESVFEAVEAAMEDVIQLIKKLNNFNASAVVVTADHGFIYQNKPIDESDFSGGDAKGESILYRHRRFVIGKGLVEEPGFKKYTSAELGLAGDVEVLIPKSINRLRQRGSGSRFVHGGSSLQEVVLPVLRVSKKRQSDVSKVDVAIIIGTNKVITTSQLGVVFYQKNPVTEKVQPRELRAGIYTMSGELISDRHVITFDVTSDSPRERELKQKFVISRKADEYNGQEVLLKLEERHEKTSHYTEYASMRYTIRRAFSNDFDF